MVVILNCHSLALLIFTTPLNLNILPCAFHYVNHVSVKIIFGASKVSDQEKVSTSKYGSKYLKKSYCTKQFG